MKGPLFICIAFPSMLATSLSYLFFALQLLVETKYTIIGLKWLWILSETFSAQFGVLAQSLFHNRCSKDTRCLEVPLFEKPKRLATNVWTVSHKVFVLGSAFFNVTFSQQYDKNTFDRSEPIDLKVLCVRVVAWSPCSELFSTYVSKIWNLFQWGLNFHFEDYSPKKHVDCQSIGKKF